MIYNGIQIRENDPFDESTIPSYPKYEEDSKMPLMQESHNFVQELKQGELQEEIKLNIYKNANFVKWVILLLLVRIILELEIYNKYII